MIQSGYTKLFGSIVASTIWREDDKTRIVWITLLALSDKDGYVAGSIPGLADLARVTIPECEQALEKLQRPDRYSRSPEHDGRRVEVVDGGWLVLNRAKYRDMGWQEDRRERDRVRQQRHRERQRDCHVTGVTSHESSDKKEEKKEKENKSKPKTWAPPTLAEVKAYCQERNNHVDPECFMAKYEMNGWTCGRTKMKDWKAAVRYWERNGMNRHAGVTKRGLRPVEELYAE